MIRLIKTPGPVKAIFPSILWNGTRDQKIIYLTFDDGPTAEATPYVMSMLEKYNARATFFCVGDNIRKHHSIFNNVVTRGHCIGNHTFNHMNGWHEKTEDYSKNIELCTEIIQSSGYLKPVKFFRPPFGKMGIGQYFNIRKSYRIVLWDILTRDYNPGNSPGLLLKRIIGNTMPGSIVVFHDSLKSLPALPRLLEPVLNHFSDKGFAFHALDNIN
jgi:peptidoglycan/xylan/chitin deacetylase (PgdA/CDA1 family)